MAAHKMEIDSGSEDFLSDEEYFHTGVNPDKPQLFPSKRSEYEEEVYGLLSSESESNDEQDNEAADDINSSTEEDVNDGLPDSRAWGKKRKNYYNADHVDPDYFGRDAEEVELEELEARNIQERLAEQLDAGASFSLDIFSAQDDSVVTASQESVRDEAEAPLVEEKVHADLSELSKRQKLELLKTESPEFFGLVNDFKEKMMEVMEKWQPMVELFEKGELKSTALEAVVRAKHELLLNYCTHIGFYLLLKSKRMPVRSHPVIKRLYQLRELLNTSSKAGENIDDQIDEIMEAVADNQQEIVKHENNTEEETKQSSRKKKNLLHVLKKGVKNEKPLSDDEEEERRGGMERKVVRGLTLQVGGGGKKKVSFSVDGGEQRGDEGEGDAMDEAGGEYEDDGKRAITYQMAKNKGLTPRRKKEQRNPRVKHKNKFRKAKIRRKGQIREVRLETSRYGGEVFGVKASVSKSIKIK